MILIKNSYFIKLMPMNVNQFMPNYWKFFDENVNKALKRT